MLARLILLIIVIVVVTIIVQRLKKTPKALRRPLYIKLGLSAAAILLILLAVTGRIHWIGAIIGAAIAITRTALPLLSSYLNHRSETSQQTQHPTQSNNELSIDDALAILGLQPGASKEQIIQAHRRMMQKVHPDRGGSDYLAAQINLAKKLLLRNCP